MTAFFVPAGACDCHAHVMATQDVDAAIRNYRATLDAAGISRGVVVQPSPYATDCSLVLRACEDLAPYVRGVGAAQADVSDAQLAAMHDAGVRGLRFTEVRNPQTGARYEGVVGVDALEALAPQLQKLGWHAELWASPAFIADRGTALADLGVPLVIDHMGLLRAEAGLDDPALRVLMDLMARDAAWVKLSVCRNTADLAAPDDVRWLHDALVAHRPDRVVWGSDWPYLGLNVPDDMPQRMLSTFGQWVADPALVQQILVDNPAALYGFADFGGR